MAGRAPEDRTRHCWERCLSPATMLSRFVKRHSGFTRRFAVVIPEMVLVTMVMDVVPVTCTDTRATKSCAPARHRQHPPRLLSPRPGSLALVLVNPSPRPSGPSPSPGADSDEDSAELRALHSDYIEDMARNYATDCSDPSLEDDEAPCPRDRESPTTTPCYTLEYISASPTGAVPILFKSSSTEQ